MALLDHPCGLAFNSEGDLYICDTGNESIRFLNLSTGIITTFINGKTNKLFHHVYDIVLNDDNIYVTGMYIWLLIIYIFF